MDPVEQEVLSGLRRHSTWVRWGHEFPLSFFQTDEAKAVYKALTTLHQDQPNGTVPLTWIQRLSKQKPELHDPLGEQATEEILKTTLQNARFLGVLKRVQQRHANGEALASADLTSEIQELGLLQLGGPSQTNGTPPRSVYQLEKDRDWKNGGDISTFLHKSLDHYLLGGVNRGELCLIQAPPNHGKSTLLTIIGYRAARAGLRTLIITCENYLDQVMVRLEQMKKLDRLKRLPKCLHLEEMDKPRVRDVEKMVNYLPDLDMLIVDHADEMGADVIDWVWSVEEIYTGLRRIGRSRDLVVWTATQEHEPQEAWQGSKRNRTYGTEKKMQKVDLALGLITAPQANRATLYLHKRRGPGKWGAKFEAVFNTDTGEWHER